MVSLYNHYDHSLRQYEAGLPLTFPWNDNTKQDVPRFFRDADGWWRDPTATPTGKALVQCVGDLICEPKVGRAHRYGDSYFFHPAFQFARPLLRQGDFNMGNLETTVSDMTPYADIYHCVAGDYHCNVHPAFLDAIRYAGIDGLTCSNNHNLDSAISGIIETNQRLDARGFARTGMFAPGETDRAMLVEVKGIRLGILAYATYFNRHDADLTDLGKDTVINAYSPEKAQADVAWAKARGAEYIIACIHFGKSYVHYPTEIQTAQAQGLADAGVDYIVGSHSHCLQINDILTACDGRSVPVIYSMGNFVTNESQDLCRHCGVLQFHLEKVDGTVTCHQTFQPCHVMNEFGTGRYCNVPVDTAMNGGWDHPELHRSAEFAAQLVTIPRPVSGAFTVADACRLWGVPVPEGLEYRGFTSISLQAIQTQDRMLYFASGKEDKFEQLQLRRREGVTIVAEEAWDERYTSIVVPDVKAAYLKLCRHLRSRFDFKALMVIGGSGKTAARTLITQALQQKFDTSTHEDGVQADLSAWRFARPGTQWFVQEVRANTPFGYDTQSKILQPQILVITSHCVHGKDAMAGMPEGGLVLVNKADSALVTSMKKQAEKHPHLRFAYYEPATAPGLLMDEAAGAAMAVARELGIENPTFSEYKGLERCITSFEDLHIVLHTACPTLASAAKALETAKSLGGRVIAIGDLRFASVLRDADVLLITQTYDDRKERHAAEFALEKAALEVIRPGDTVLLCGMRDVTLNTTARRLFGFTDGIISDVW